jgi:hypothetical protein
MKGGTCDRSWELDAYREGRLGDSDAASYERHLRACRACAELRADSERVRDLARRIETEAPDALRLRRLRRRILDDVALDRRDAPSSRRGAWIALGAAALLLVAGAARGKGHRPAPAPSSLHATTPSENGAAASPASPVEAAPPAPRWAGTLTPSEGSRWSRSREAEVERIQLEAGSLSIHVRPQQPGERFLVVLPDGDLEVRGTTFDVSVKGARTTAVHVTEGVVELRIAGNPMRRLEAGGTWSPLAPASPSASASPSPGSSASKAPPHDDGETAYAAALRALGAGDNEGASAALRAFVVAHPEAPQTEDATFLEAVALARAGRIDAAGAAAEEHLARFPSSFHRKEALVLVDRAARARDAGRTSPHAP